MYKPQYGLRAGDVLTAYRYTDSEITVVGNKYQQENYALPFHITTGSDGTENGHCKF